MGERQGAFGLVRLCWVPLVGDCWGGLGLAKCPSAMRSSPVRLGAPGVVVPGCQGLHVLFGVGICGGRSAVRFSEGSLG